MNWPLHNSGQLLAHASTLHQSANPTVCLSDCRSADPLSSVQSITSSFGIFEEKYLTLLVAIVWVLASFLRFTKAGSFEDYACKIWISDRFLLLLLSWWTESIVKKVGGGCWCCWFCCSIWLSIIYLVKNDKLLCFTTTERWSYRPAITFERKKRL